MMKGLIGSSLIPIMASLLVACGGVPLTIDTLKIDETPKVVLGFTGEPPVFQILKDGSTKCKDNSKKAGCIDSPLGKAVIARFALRGSPDWEFSRFQICSGGDKPEPGTCKLELFQRFEFGAYAKKLHAIRLPNAEGIIELGELDDKRLDSFFVANANSFAANYYYRVEVCQLPEKDSCVWNEDPRWVNKGH